MHLTANEAYPTRVSRVQISPFPPRRVPLEWPATRFEPEGFLTGMGFDAPLFATFCTYRVSGKASAL